MINRIAGRYQLVREIGVGGMGRVYEAVDVQSGRRVAVKVLLGGGQFDRQILLRFMQEGALLSTLKHPHIVEVYEAHLEEQVSSIIMELLEGQTLGRLMQRERLSLARVKQLMLQVVSALVYAHSHGVIHRDIKPENIMVLAGDRVKVMDFGIARIVQEGTGIGTLTGTGMSMGTPLYISPEQIEGHRVDGRTDIYSLGCVLYQLVTGSPPFRGNDPLTLAFRHVHKAPEPPSNLTVDLPDDWEELILTCLSKNPAGRYQSAAALEEAMATLDVRGQEVAQPRAVPRRAEDEDERAGASTLETEARTLLEQGKSKELAGDVRGALKDYRIALTLASPGLIRQELQASVARLSQRNVGPGTLPAPPTTTGDSTPGTRAEGTEASHAPTPPGGMAGTPTPHEPLRPEPFAGDKIADVATRVLSQNQASGPGTTSGGGPPQGPPRRKSMFRDWRVLGGGGLLSVAVIALVFFLVHASASPSPSPTPTPVPVATSAPVPTPTPNAPNPTSTPNSGNPTPTPQPAVPTPTA